MNTLIDPCGIADPTDEAIKQMRESPYNFPDTVWYAYQNHDLGHPDIGRTAFLAVGSQNTFKTPPKNYPDSQATGLGWRYVLVGQVDMGRRCITKLSDTGTK